MGVYVGVGIATRSQSELAPRVAGARKEPAAEDATIVEVGNSDMPPMIETHGLASLPRASPFSIEGESTYTVEMAMRHHQHVFPLPGPI